MPVTLKRAGGATRLPSPDFHPRAHSYHCRPSYIYIRIHIYIYMQHGSRGNREGIRRRIREWKTESRRKFTMNTGIREFTTNYCYYPTRREREGKVRSSSERSTLSRSRRKIATRRRKEAAAFHVRAVLSYIYRYESYTIENPRDPSRGEEKERWEEKEKEGGRRGRTTSRRNARESERERERERERESKRERRMKI